MSIETTEDRVLDQVTRAPKVFIEREIARPDHSTLHALLMGHEPDLRIQSLDLPYFRKSLVPQESLTLPFVSGAIDYVDGVLRASVDCMLHAGT